MQIRPFVPETDMEHLVATMNQVNPMPITLEEMWHRERSAPASLIRRRLVAVADDGQVMGFGSTAWANYMADGRFHVRVMVNEPYRGRGVGSALYEQVQRLARELGARELESSVREIHPEAVRFAQNRGFRVRRHLFGSSLDLATFDEQPFTGALAQAEAAGFRFFTFADIPDTEANRRLYYDLDMETNLDIPGNEYKAIPYEEWESLVFKAQWYRPDGQIFAAQGDRWAGTTSVSIYPNTGVAYNSFTGIRREFRGQGLAHALKLLSIRTAQKHGMTRIRTSNDSENGPMLAVNRKFGYVPESGEYFLIRDSL